MSFSGFLLSDCGSRTDYQNFVLENLRKYYPNPDSIARSTWDIIDRFWNLDLSFTDEFMKDKYSVFGSKPRTPSYIFIRLKSKKPKTKGTKAESVEKIKVDQLLPELENTSFDIKEQPYGSLFTLYVKEFLNQSVSKGLINPESLALAGNGTPVVTSHRERKHRVCDCASKSINDCQCDRYFSQPDCDIGWDSSRDCWYHGYDLYMLVASDSDLPVFPLLNPVSMHDSHGFLHTFFRMKNFLPNLVQVSKAMF